VALGGEQSVEVLQIVHRGGAFIFSESLLIVAFPDAVIQPRRRVISRQYADYSLGVVVEDGVVVF